MRECEYFGIVYEFQFSLLIIWMMCGGSCFNVGRRILQESTRACCIFFDKYRDTTI